MLKDGSLAWDVKDYLITQPDCLLVEFENQQFPGAGDKTKSSKQNSDILRLLKKQ